jgi:VanZ family protein
MRDTRPTSRLASRWIPVLVWMTVIFAVSSIRGSSLPGGPPGLAHFVEYAVLGALLVWALLRSVPQRSVVALAVLLASGYGITDELHQLLVPQRTADVADWGVDTIGALVGALVLSIALSRLRRRSGEPSSDAERDHTAT